MVANIVEFPVNTLSKEEILESINEAMPKDINKFKGYAFVLYDDKNGANAASRLWWMLKSIGHAKVQVLNGGFQEAERLNFPINSRAVVTIPTKQYKIDNWRLPIATIDEVESASKTQSA